MTPTATRLDDIVVRYLAAKDVVLASGYAHEIDWQYERRIDALTHSAFLRELAWVVLSSGMRESVIRGLFGRVSKAFLDWDIDAIRLSGVDYCCGEALAAFRHSGKIRAIGTAVRRLSALERHALLDAVRSDGIEFLVSFPYIGSVTAYHLAKNIGLDVCKPDRHLVRFAEAFESTPATLCEVIASRLAEPLRVVDVVLWRYLVLTYDYNLSLPKADAIAFAAARSTQW